MKNAVTLGFIKIAVGLIIIFGIHSCRVDSGKRYNQAISESAYEQATRISKSVGIEAAQYFADSLYNRLSKPTAVDFWRKRIFDASMSNAAGLHQQSLDIIDSLIVYLEDPSRFSSMKSYLALTYLQKGDIYNDVLFQNDKAYTNYVRARIIGLDLDDRCLLSAYDARFAVVLYKRQFYREAVTYFNKALQHYDGCENDVEYFKKAQRWIDNIALSYSRAGQLDSAMVYHRKALSYIDENRYRVAVDTALVEMAKGVIFGNLGQTLVSLGRPDEAEPYLRKSIEYNSRPGFDNNDASLARLHLANLLLSVGNINEVGALIEDVEMYTSLHPNPTTIARMLDTRSRYRQSRGFYERALEDRLEENRMRDSLMRANLLVFDADATNEYNYILAQQELERLKNENQIRTMWLIVGNIVFSLFAVVLLLLYYAWSQSKRSMTLLSELNVQINQQKQELESTVQLLKEASAEKDLIMWMVAHDLRNPLGAIENLAQLLEYELVSDDGKEVVDQISFASKSAQKFIGDILTLADEDRLKIDVRNTNIEELLQRTVDMMQFQAKEKGQLLVYEGLGHDMLVSIDPEKITRAVFNLIGNAVKFSPEGAEVRVQLSVQGDKLLIHVADRGIGVPEGMRESIFESFTKSKRAGTSGEKPYGLGLSIARSIVMAHKGSIDLQDNPSGGAIFTIELPTS